LSDFLQIKEKTC